MPPDDDTYDVYFPVALKLRDRKVVFIGGGEEARRKIKAMAPCGARLVVVSPDPGPAIRKLAEAGRVTLVDRPYRCGDLEGALLAVCCQAEVSEAVHAEAVRRGVLLNAVDQPELCDVIAMANFSRDGLQVGVHSSGKSAALARRVRERFEAELGPTYAELTNLLGRLRPIVHGMIPTAEGRRRFWLELVDAELLDRVGTTLSMEDLKREILARAEAFGGGQGEQDGVPRIEDKARGEQ